MKNHSLIAFEIWFRQLFKGLVGLLGFFLMMLGWLVGIFLCGGAIAASALWISVLIGLAGSGSEWVNVISSHVLAFGIFHLTCLALALVTTLCFRGVGLFREIQGWLFWPMTPDSTGREISSWIAIPYWMALMGSAVPLLALLGVVNGVLLVLGGIRHVVLAILHSPEVLRRKRDAILENNPEVLARLEKARLGESVGEAMAPVRRSRL
jgi:hypothetical protein